MGIRLNSCLNEPLIDYCCSQQSSAAGSMVCLDEVCERIRDNFSRAQNQVAG